MPLPNLDLVKVKGQDKPLVKLWLEFILIFGLCLFSVKNLVDLIWLPYFSFLHTFLEAICVFIPLVTFVVVWHTYERNSLSLHLIGFGFLMLALFQAIHICYSLGGYYAQYSVLALIYTIPCRVVEALCFFLSTQVLKKKAINKYWGLALTLSLVLISYYSLFYTQKLIIHLTPILQLSSSCFVFTCLGLTLYRIRSKVNQQEILTYRYIFLAALLIIPTEILITFPYFYWLPFYNISSHLLKVVAYYYLFKGIFVSAIKYPYQQLEQREKYNTSILNNLPLSLVIYNSELKLTFTNQKALDLFQCQEEEIKNLSKAEIVKKFSITNKATNQLVKARPASEDFAKDIVVSLQNSLGKKINLKANIHQLNSGDFLFFFTEAKKDQELENLQLQTQTVLNAISSAILVVNTKGQLVLCNKAFTELTEINTKEFLGQDTNQLAQAIKFSEIDFSRKILQNTTLPRVHQAYFLTPRNEKKELLIHTSYIHNIEGELLGYIAVCSDITLFKKEQQKMQQQDKLASLGQMAAGIVHEIKNPLTTIKGFSQLIAAKATDKKIKDYSATIESEVEDVNKLVSAFLTFAKPCPPALQPTSLNKIVKGLELMLETQSFMKRIALKIILTPEEELVLIDQNQIKQVIINLIENALDAMDKVANPLLTIQTGQRKTTQEMFLSISDNGKGISSEELAKIGTPFFTTKDKGTGLGLSICYQIIKEHGGRIELESRLNQGTNFTIYLPCRD